jgi:hypothetical protein
MSVAIEDHPRPPGAPAYVLWLTAASPGYFDALGIPLLEGRRFTDADRLGAPPVIIISESTAKRFWPNESAMGKRIRPVWLNEWRTVVGVAADVAQYSLAGFPSWVDGVQYCPLAQVLPQVSQTVQLAVFLNAAEPQSVERALAPVLREQFPDLAVTRIGSLDKIRAESVADQRSTTWLLLLFAGLGLLLGVIGVHGVVAHRASQRTREIGIRMALGATRPGVVGMVLRETLWAALLGCAGGTAAAFLVSRYLESLLFGITAHDPIAFTLAPLALLATALVSAVMPGLRAARIDPASTLRVE